MIMDRCSLCTIPVRFWARSLHLLFFILWRPFHVFFRKFTHVAFVSICAAETLYRSDFFPGLGWMLSKTIWDELSPKWPKAYPCLLQYVQFLFNNFKHLYQQCFDFFLDMIILIGMIGWDWRRCTKIVNLFAQKFAEHTILVSMYVDNFLGNYH